jgi:hypothetical protein
MPVKIFFCYAHEDESLLNKLKKHLKPFQREGLIDTWYDRDITAGTEWEREISEQLNTSQLILLLISPDFMDSEMVIWNPTASLGRYLRIRQPDYCFNWQKDEKLDRICLCRPESHGSRVATPSSVDERCEEC